MTVALIAVLGFALAVVLWSVFRVRELRRDLQRAGSIVFKAQARRAHQFNQFCEPCKKIVNPWWQQ